MDQSRKQLFTGATFSLKEDGSAAFCYPSCHIDKGPHLQTPVNDLICRYTFLFKFLTEEFIFSKKGTSLRDTINKNKKLFKFIYSLWRQPSWHQQPSLSSHRL